MTMMTFGPSLEVLIPRGAGAIRCGDHQTQFDLWLSEAFSRQAELLAYMTALCHLDQGGYGLEQVTGRSLGPLGSMLPVVERGQPMDGTLTQLVGIPLAVACSLHNSSGNDFPIYFQLTDVLKRSTCQVVRRVDGGYLLRVNG